MEDDDFDDAASIVSDDDSDTETDAGQNEVAKEDIKLMNVIRAIVILFLLTAAFISAETVFVIATIGEQHNFDEAYLDVSTSIIESFSEKVAAKIWAAKSLATDLELSAIDSDVIWPFVTYTDFQRRCQAAQHMTAATSISFLPLVHRGSRSEWEAYATRTGTMSRRVIKNANTTATQVSVEYRLTGRSLSDGIYRFDNETAIDQENGTSFLLPIWQTAPELSPPDTELTGTMFDELSSSARHLRQEEVLKLDGSFLSDFLYSNDDRTDYASYLTPHTSIYYPIHNIQAKIVGAVSVEVPFDSFLDGSLKLLEDRPLHIVAKSSCGGSFTFETKYQGVTFVGAGDLHNKAVDGYKPIASNMTEFYRLIMENGNANATQDACLYQITVYPTAAFKSLYLTPHPDIYLWIVIVVFLMMVSVFIIYDCLIERRQSRVVVAAARSEAIVRSLFPSNIRDRLYEQAKLKQETNKKGDKNNWKITEDEDASNDGIGKLIESPKHRLKNFISQSPADEAHAQATSNHNHNGTEPIADLFQNTTVLFADLAGFTAWSSEREPWQVFTLLETLYRAMDKIAKRLVVFKVETVGDCYVACTGLPDPQPFHAVIMARYARACLIRVTELTKSLEVQLGPGTADLAMRIGIHSGPVTAGVLRGQKARFQLFGDTMNTAARLEGSGLKNKIHISQETADLLITSKKQHWVVPRSDRVVLKGKGELQTYWLVIRSNSSSHASTELSDEINDSTTAVGSQQPRKGRSALWEGTRLEKVLGQTKIDDALERLVDWNVDVLLSLLTTLVTHRAATKTPSSHSLVAEAESKIGGGLVFDEVQMIIELPDFAPTNEIEPIQLHVEIKAQLKEYVAAIASGYPRNSFHNFEHASHVILSANKLLKRIMAPDEVNQKAQITAQDLYQHTYGIGTDPLGHFCVVFSALIHDVGHTGVPNGQLATEDPVLAEQYQHQSIAEQRSVDVAWDLLMLPAFNQLRQCIYGTPEECIRFRQLLVNSVLATDIFDKQLKALRNERWDLAFHAEQQTPPMSLTISSPLTSQDMNRKATIVIEHIIQASDVSHTMQHWYIYQKWNERLYREMYFAFLAHRIAKDPSDGWYEGELWFFDNYVIPLARKLEECGVFGVSSDEYLNYALQNRNEWERKGRQVCAGFAKRAVRDAETMGLLHMEPVLEDKKEESDSADDETVPDTQLSPEAVPVPKNESVSDLLAMAGHNAGAPASSDSLNAVSPPIIDSSVHSTDSCSKLIVSAPPGKLGIVLDTSPKSGGPLVHEVYEGSALQDRLQTGDRIVAMDGIDTQSMSVSAMTALMSSKITQPREFTIWRSNSNRSCHSSGHETSV